MTPQQLSLKVLLPTMQVLNRKVGKIIAEADNGEFCILPRHIDFVSSLVPSVLTYWEVNPNEINANQDKENIHYIAVDQGVLIKCADVVTVTTWNAVCSNNLEQLEYRVNRHFLDLDEQERKARTALARLEAATLRGFRELQEGYHDRP